MKPQAWCGMRFAGGWCNPETPGKNAATLRGPVRFAYHPRCGMVRCATIPSGTTGTRICAASVIVGALHGFRSWLPLSGGSMLVRNSWEHLRPSNRAAPDPTPPWHCPPLPQTKGDLLPRFSLGLSSSFENKSDMRLPSCAESRDSESRNYFARGNELDRNLGALPVERHREWI